MSLLYYWKCKNYRKDMEQGHGFRLAQSSPTFGKLSPGEQVWAFTQREDGRYVIAACLEVDEVKEEQNSYGSYVAYGDPERSRYFDIDRGNDVERLIRSLGLVTNASYLGMAFQGTAAVRPLSEAAIAKLVKFSAKLPTLQKPDWQRDELILALHLYRLYEGNPPGKKSREIGDLSQLLRAMNPRQVHIHPDYRNANGVYMKLMNFRRHDPKFKDQGKKGLKSGNQEEKEVWEMFFANSAQLKSLAEDIRASVEDGSYATVASAMEQEFSLLQEAPEGRTYTVTHLRRERSRKLVESKKRHVMKQRGKLACEACDFDFKEMYGDVGIGIIECHHTKPLHTLEDGEVTKLDDLALLCSNCHRLVHSTRPWLSLDALKKVISISQG